MHILPLVRSVLLPSCLLSPVTLAAVSLVLIPNSQVFVCRRFWVRSLKGRQRVCPGSGLQLSARPGGWWRPWPSMLSRQRHWPLHLSTSPAHEQAGTPRVHGADTAAWPRRRWPVIEQVWPGCWSHAVCTRIPPQNQRHAPVLLALHSTGPRAQRRVRVPSECWSAPGFGGMGCLRGMVTRRLQIVAFT